MVSLKNKKQNRVVYVLALLVFASGAFFLTPSQAHAFDWFDILTTNPIKSILYGIFWVCGLFTSVAITIFEWAVNPDYISGDAGLLNRASVYAMWKFIRDFFNLFFILTLLYTAFTIVFQVAKDYKKTLLSLVLAALFINFSFPVTRVIIDMTNVPMYYFINQIGSSGSGKTHILGTFLSASQIQGILIPGSEADSSGSAAGQKLSDIAVSQLIMATIFLFLFSITLLVLATLFIIRLAALVMLLVFSPIGFAAAAIPALQRYSSQWWDKLWQYTLFGPAAMLMILVATRFFAEISKDNTKEQFLKVAIENSTKDSAGFISSMAMFTLPLVMIWMAIGLANSFSIAGAGAVTGMGQRFAKWAGKSVTKTPAMFIGRKIDSKLAGSRVGQYFSPGAWRAALKQRGEEQKHRDELPIKLAAATRQDQLNNVLSRAKNSIIPTHWFGKGREKFGKNTDHTDHRFAERQSQKAKYAKEMSEVSDRSSIILEHLQNAIHAGNASEAEAAISILAKNNDLNDMIIALGKEYTGDNEVSSKNAKNLIEAMLKKAGVKSEEDIAKTMTVLSDQALASGNYAFGGMSSYNEGKFTISKDTGDGSQSEQVAGKFNNLEPQKQATMLHPDALFKRTADGFTDMNDDVAAAIAPSISKAAADQSNRSRSDMRTAIKSAWDKACKSPNLVPNFAENYNKHENFRYYVFKMLEQQGALEKDVMDSKGEKGDYKKFIEKYTSFPEVREVVDEKS